MSKIIDMTVTTTITITHNVPANQVNQVKRNFERDPNLDGGDVNLRKHIQKLMPVLRDDEIDINFEMTVIESD